MTEQASSAFDAMIGHHKALVQGVNSRVENITLAKKDGKDAGRSIGDFAAYFRAEIIPHAYAEEEVIYARALIYPDLTGIIAQMKAEHEVLIAHVTTLESLSASDITSDSIQEIASLFENHVAKENELILPRLDSDAEVGLAELLDNMHKVLERLSANEQVLDATQIAPRERHEKIFETFGGLAPGQGFVLQNDHDPKPLRYQFEAELPGQFTWDPIEAGPERWRIRICRSA